jgi:hypothetical protein
MTVLLGLILLLLFQPERLLHLVGDLVHLVVVEQQVVVLVDLAEAV